MDLKKDMLLCEVYNVDCEKLTTNSPLEIWYKNVLQKTFARLTTTDAVRMLTQGVLIEIGLRKAIEILLSDPTAGIYPMQLLELLCSQPTDKLNSIKNINNIFSKIYQKLEAIDSDIQTDLKNLIKMKQQVQSMMKIIDSLIQNS
jgi:plasmid rolling circle replication initiator protein Rep